MKILMVLRAPTGGLWRHAVDLSEALALRHHDVGLALDAGFTDAQTQAGLDRLAPLLTLGIHRLPIARQPGFGDLSAAWRIRKLAKRLGVDIVHGHGAKGGIYARLAAVGTRHRVSVYTPHGGVIHYLDRPVLGMIVRGLEKTMLGITDAIIFESEFASKIYSDRIGAPQNAWQVIHNGLGAADFAFLADAQTRFDFAFVGELRTLKGVSVLLQALAGARHPDGTPASLVLAGSGPDEETFRKEATRLGLDERVRFVGVKPAREVFATTGCVVMPSLAESLPYVILEAAATGRQVIATRVGGIGEIFGPYAGALVPPGDVEALGKAMTDFLADPEDGARQGAQLREYVIVHFNAAGMTDAIEELYREIAPKHG